VSHVTGDLLCISCGYNLRGLSPRGDCAECGFPIVSTLRGAGLRCANPQWLNSTAAGFLWLMLAYPLWFMWTTQVLYLASRNSSLGPEILALGLVPIGIRVYGFRLASRPSPGKPSSGWQSGWRAAGTVAFFVTVLMIFASILADLGYGQAAMARFLALVMLADGLGMIFFWGAATHVGRQMSDYALPVLTMIATASAIVGAVFVPLCLLVDFATIIFIPQSLFLWGFGCALCGRYAWRLQDFAQEAAALERHARRASQRQAALGKV
jgi:hypothetical protein